MPNIPPTRTTTIPIIVGGGAGTVCTPGTGYHNRRLLGGVFVTDVYNERISKTVTPHRVIKEGIQDNVTVTHKLRVESGAQIVADQQYASADLSTSPQILQMNTAGSLTIFFNAADPGDVIIVNNPFIADASADISIVESGLVGTTTVEFNNLLVADIGQAIITMPANVPVNSSGYIILQVN